MKIDRVTLPNGLTVKDDKRICGKKDQETRLLTNRYLTSIRKVNKSKLTETQIYKLIYDIYLEEIAKWLIEEKKEFTFYNNYITLVVINKDNLSIKYKYNIERHGNDPMLFIKAHKNMYKKFGRHFLATFTGKAKDMFDDARERFEEYLSLKERGYVKTKDA